MSVSDIWFHSGAYTLAGHLDLPAAGSGRKGVLIVPPFGWEDVCSYRSLRFLGQALAENGIPAMRFDLPGTGDSSGGPMDPGLVDAWIKSVIDATAELRRLTGVQEVGILGLRLGATLSVAAASAGADVEHLILWGPAVNGRSILRELRAFQMMEQAKERTSEVTRSQSPGLEIAGFQISPETQKDLEALDLSVLTCLAGKRTLILTRDNLPADENLFQALRASGSAVEVTSGAGYAAMLADPHDAIPPAVTGKRVIDFLKFDAPEQSQTRETFFAPRRPSAQTTTAEAIGVLGHEHREVRETMLRLRGSQASAFGILSEPGQEAPQTDLGLLFLNPGAARHIGPNRMWVEAARRWALRGVPAVRLDFSGVGEAEGDRAQDLGALYQGDVVDQVEMAMDALRQRSGSRRYVVIGLCSGAFWAFHSAVRNPAVREAILLNPRLLFWDPEVDRRRIMRQAVTHLTTVNAWARLARGDIKLQRIKQAAQAALGNFHQTRVEGEGGLQIPPTKLADALLQVEKNRNRLTFIFAEGEVLLREMEDESQLPPEDGKPVRCLRVAGANHTFRSLWAQQLVHDLMDRIIEDAMRETPSALAETLEAERLDFPGNLTPRFSSKAAH